MGKHRGTSLIEMGVVILFVSLAMVPVINMIGGKTGQDTGVNSTITGASRTKARQVVAANTLIERALSGDTSVGVDTSQLAKGGTLSTQRYSYSDYKNPIWYEWTLKDVSYQMDSNGNLVKGADGQPVPVAPKGNRLVQATLKVFDSADASTPNMLLPTYIFRNEQGYPTGTAGKTGIVIVQDNSGSMAWAKVSNSLTVDPDYNVASPFMFYRHRPTDPYTSDLFEDSQLDLVVSMPYAGGADPDPTTPYREDYINENVLGLGECYKVSNWTKAPKNNLENYFTPRSFNGNPNSSATQRGIARELCSPKTAANWDDLVNNYISRIEAARSSLLSFLVEVESNPSLPASMKLGLVTFSDKAQKRVDLEDAQTKGTRQRFVNMRETVAWINRANPTSPKVKTIGPGGGTNIYNGIEVGAKMLLDDKDIKNRMIVLISDGAPTVGKTSTTDLVNLCKQLGTGTYPGADGKTITVFTVGVISADNNLMGKMAAATPSGEFFFAKSVADTKPVLDQVAYQASKLALMETANRYNLDIK